MKGLGGVAEIQNYRVGRVSARRRRGWEALTLTVVYQVLIQSFLKFGRTISISAEISVADKRIIVSLRGGAASLPNPRAPEANRHHAPRSVKLLQAGVIESTFGGRIVVRRAKYAPVYGSKRSRNRTGAGRGKVAGSNLSPGRLIVGAHDAKVLPHDADIADDLCKRKQDRGRNRKCDGDQEREAHDDLMAVLSGTGGQIDDESEHEPDEREIESRDDFQKYGHVASPIK